MTPLKLAFKHSHCLEIINSILYEYLIAADSDLPQQLLVNNFNVFQANMSNSVSAKQRLLSC